MTLNDIIKVLNLQVKYDVIDRFTRKEVKVNPRDKETLRRKIYMVFQQDDRLKIYLY